MVLLLGSLMHFVASANEAEKIGWISDQRNFCGGYFSEIKPNGTNSDQVILKWKGTGIYVTKGPSALLGGVNLFGRRWQLHANQVYFNRTADTMELDHLHLVDDLQLLQPDLQVSAQLGDYYLKNKHYALQQVQYRMVLKKRLLLPLIPSPVVPTITAIGSAKSLIENETDVRELTDATFSTCPPDTKPAWRLYAGSLKLNSKTGRGEAKQVTLKVKEVPVLYLPYFTFSIDRHRQSGFLLPMAGVSNRLGMFVRVPYYFNLAPNYDFLLTTSDYGARGVEAAGLGRYLTEHSFGDVDFAILPNDRRFKDYKKTIKAKLAAGEISADRISAAEQLVEGNSLRSNVRWQHHTVFNSNWSWSVNYRRVSDDYYLQDFIRYDDLPSNQLLQQTEVQFHNLHWQVLLRAEAYQTLQPINEPITQKQYRRMPQLQVNAFYPEQDLGLTYTFRSEAVHFVGYDATPGGTRFHLEPGVSLPFIQPYGEVVPRVRFALTQYELQSGLPSQHTTLHRALPIFDVNGSLYFDRTIQWQQRTYQHTLEPQLYYLYIPYHNQNNLPLFDTTGNAINYDTIFSPNRFSGIDRIGDANQVSLGFMTRFIDSETGLERVHLGVGQIAYFKQRRVTICQNEATCLPGTDYPGSNDNTRVLSPFSTNLAYQLDERWQFLSDSSWLLPARELLTLNAGLRYTDAKYGLWNANYQFVKGGTPLTGLTTVQNDLYITDLSFVLPFNEQVSVIGRWTQDWKEDHFQNMVYGIQYDSCCYAVRLLAGKSFINFSDTKEPQYNKEIFLQISLKGLGQLATGTDSLLTNIVGFETKKMR